MDSLRLLLEERVHPAIVDDGSGRSCDAIDQCRALIVYLNTGTMAISVVHDFLRLATSKGKVIIVVYEKDGRHGATFNTDGGVDFQAAEAMTPEV